MQTTQQKQKSKVCQQTTALMKTINRVRGKTDGCTNSPDLNFVSCCITHDLRYRENTEGITRAQADKELRECIAAHGHQYLAWIYWGAVRLFGRSNWRSNH
jgi:hypothetical protein